jgi:hypothetical protein
MEMPIADAGIAAIKRATDEALARSKADVAASGLGSRWVASFKSRFYENKGLDAAGLIYSRINFGVVFERGATVPGNPTLWIPLQTTPKKLGGKRLTAKVFHEQIGHLFKTKIDGRDYLAARIAVSKRQTTGPLPLLSAAMLKNRAKPKAGQRTRLIPMFVGKSSTTIQKRLHIGEITQAAAARLGEYYAAAIKGTTNG